MSKLIGAKLGETAYLSVTDDGKLQYSLTGADGDFVEFETSGGTGDIDTSTLTATADDLLEGETAIGLDGAEITGTIQTVTLQQNGNTVSIAKGYVAEDASITVSGEGGGTDISDATATNDMVLAGAIFYGLNGRGTGTIQTVTATLTDNVVTVPKGYIAEAQTLTVAVAEAPTVSDNVVTVHKGYVTADTDVTIATAVASKSGNVVTIPKGYHQGQTVTVGTAKEAETIVPGDEDIIIPADTYLAGDLTIQAVGESGGTGDSNIAYGVLDADGNFQALDLSGENPVDSGTAESISELVMYQTGHDEPAYPSGGGEVTDMKFYECISVDGTTWSGYEMSQMADTLKWTVADTVTTGLQVRGEKPVVGKVYGRDTTIELINIVLDHRGALYGWGGNQYGQLGLGGSLDTRLSPTLISVNEWQSVSSGKYDHVYFQNTANEWYCCGRNEYGQLGLGDVDSRSSLTSAPTVSAAWKQISCGTTHSVGIDANGHLWAWGRNHAGQLGLGDTTDRTSPVQVGTDTWKKVACEINTTFAIGSNGFLWSWGYSYYGNVGSGSTNYSQISLVQIGSSVWQDIICGCNFCFAIQGGVWYCWGDGQYGQLGFGDTNKRTTPTEFTMALSQISCGHHHIAGIDANGYLWVCGYNHAGQLGLGDTTDRTSPVQVGTDTWKKVACFGHTTFAQKTNGVWYCCGLNDYGQLGLGDTENRNTLTETTLSADSILTGGMYNGYTITATEE